jgi:hypothetical protein
MATIETEGRNNYGDEKDNRTQSCAYGPQNYPQGGAHHS